ncbi:unnamed protein product [Laminaria digitata]
MGKDATPASGEPKPEVVAFDGPVALGDKLGEHFGTHLGLPNIETNDLCLLDEAIAMLNPPEAQIRVIEVETFLESERSIAKGDIAFGKGSFSRRQMAIIAKRVPTSVGKDEEAASEEKPSTSEVIHGTEAGDAKVGEGASATAKPDKAGATAAPISGSGEEVEEKSQNLPEIVLFWARNRRRGGTLVVCPDKSMDRLIQAYVVCEVVEASRAKQSISSFRDGIIPEREGVLMGVELGEATVAEQDALDSLLSNYSFHDASIGVVALALSIYWFGVEGRNDVNVLTLLAVAVVAGLNQEASLAWGMRATWPWVFKLILHCSRIKDPIVRVSQCRRVHHHQGQLSGQGFLAIGLAVFGVYLEIFPDEDGSTPLVFRILLNVFQGGMIVALVVNMIQAVEPMAMADLKAKDRLRSHVRPFLEDTVFDTKWYLTLLVTIVWAGIIALMVTYLPYGGNHLGWSIVIICLVVIALSAMTMNPGVAILCVWGLVFLAPVGLAFVLRSAFDTTMLLINRVSLVGRRMARELVSHVKTTARRKFRVQDTLILLVQVLPLTPLFLVFLPLPMLYFLSWLLHVTLRLTLLLADAIIFPLSPLSLYPLLSDYGSVTWKMGRLTMDVEDRSMRSLLKARVSKLMETSGLGERVKSGVLPSKPYGHLNQTSIPKLGCIAVVKGEEEEERVLFVSPSDPARKGRARSCAEASGFNEGGMESAAAEV